MRAVRTFFVFHDQATPGQIWRREHSPWAIFQHVSAYGFTRDNTWWFFDPLAGGTRLMITHHHDEIEAEMVRVFATSSEIYATDHQGQLRLPSLAPMTCVAQCAHLIGIRAWTPGGFRRKLARIGAEPIHETQGRP